MTGARVFVKLESLQIRSPSERGAATCSSALRRLGRARRRGQRATIAWRRLPAAKLGSPRSSDARVGAMSRCRPPGPRRRGILTVDSRGPRAPPRSEARGGAGLVHPSTMPGSSPVGHDGLELLEQVPDLDAVLVRWSSAAHRGIGTAIKRRPPLGYRSACREIAAMQAALAGDPGTGSGRHHHRRGIAVRRVAEPTLALARRYLDAVVPQRVEFANASLLLLGDREDVVMAGGVRWPPWPIAGWPSRGRPWRW